MLKEGVDRHADEPYANELTGELAAHSNSLCEYRDFESHDSPHEYGSDECHMLADARTTVRNYSNTLQYAYICTHIDHPFSNHPHSRVHSIPSLIGHPSIQPIDLSIFILPSSASFAPPVNSSLLLPSFIHSFAHLFACSLLR